MPCSEDACVGTEGPVDGHQRARPFSLQGDFCLRWRLHAGCVAPKPPALLPRRGETPRMTYVRDILSRRKMLCARSSSGGLRGGGNSDVRHPCFVKAPAKKWSTGMCVWILELCFVMCDTSVFSESACLVLMLCDHWTHTYNQSGDTMLY